MAKDKTMFELVRHPVVIRRLEVVRVVDLTPRMRRVTLGGPALEGFVSLAPEDHVKVFFPRRGEREPVVPTLGPMGLPIPPLFGPKPIARDYTPRRFDAARRELDLDFFLHDAAAHGGVAGAWAAQAAPGQILALGGPRGSYVLKEAPSWHLFVGDETAQPEMAYRIEQLPAGTPVKVVSIVEGAEEEQPWPVNGPLDARWVHRAGSDASDALIVALRALDLEAPGGFAWLAGEANETRAVRRHLVGERGFPKARVHASGHWKRGVVGHDHHEEIA